MLGKQLATISKQFPLGFIVWLFYYIWHMNKIIVVLFLPLLYLHGYSQQILINPYLQDASPTSITVMWEADGQYSSRLEWGTSSTLTDTIIPTSEVSFLTSYIYTAIIPGLLGNSKYYYRVSSGGLENFDA